MQPRLERVELGVKDVLYEAQKPIEHVYFIESGVASVIAELGDDTAIELATIGNEGMVGIALYLGSQTSPNRSFFQVPGAAFRMSARDFRATIKELPGMNALLSRYIAALFTQIAQASACNRAHLVEQRCARWLLMTHDRVGNDEFPLTQLFLAQMLGVRRATVTEIAAQLAKRGCIEYERGTIRILNREELEHASCECYSIIRDEYIRLLGAPGQ